MSAKYLLIARELEQQLRLTPTRKLPTEAQLCQRFDCSRQTVRNALDLLCEKGLIVRRRGSGSYPAGSVSINSRVIAVILADREEYTSPALLRALSAAAALEGCELQCLETRGDRAAEAEHLSALLRSRPLGIVLEPITDALGCFNAGLIEQLRSFGIPVVCINGRYPETASAVSGDDETAVGRMIAQLAAGGHRQIAAVLKSDETRRIRRYHAACLAAQEHRVFLRSENVLWYSEQERRRLLEGSSELLDRFFRDYLGSCTAVLCFNDELAFRLARAAGKADIRLALASFDGSYLARSASIMSASLNRDAAARAAVRLLLQGRGSRTLNWDLDEA